MGSPSMFGGYREKQEPGERRGIITEQWKEVVYMQVEEGERKVLRLCARYSPS